MNEHDEAELRRLKWYGTNDYATFFQTERAAEVLASFEAGHTFSNINDVLELANAREFAERGLLPRSFSDDQLTAAREQVSQIDAALGRFFSQLTNENVAERVAGLHFNYQGDLLDLLARFGALGRLESQFLIPALEAVDIRVGQMLLSRALVRAFDAEVRALLLGESQNAELVVRKHLERDQRQEIHLPRSMTAADSRRLIEAYVDSDDPNPNFLKLVADSASVAASAAGIDNELRLKARRKYAAVTERFFADNAGFRFGSEVAISDNQVEPVEASIDDQIAKYSYARSWLEENLDHPTVLNNFIHLFEFANQHVVLTLPAYAAEFGVFERVLGIGGVTDYATGTAFQVKDQASFLQLIMYDRFLADRDLQLEHAVKWFFEEYLPAEFGAQGFHFSPSSPTATYLERCRNLFPEMESVAKQYALFTNHGELDPELLAMTDQFTYRSLPSAVFSKYLYATDNADIRNIMHLLFSDQSSLQYISEAMRGDDLVQLLTTRSVAYDDFADHQKPQIDYLIDQGIISNNGSRLVFANMRQIVALKELSSYEVIAYRHYSAESQVLLDEMAAKDWLRQESTLLTHAEASYFNYILNNSEYGNGPALRNRYSHGTPTRDENAHFQAYAFALRLLICLVLKINDDFGLRTEARGTGQDSPPFG